MTTLTFNQVLAAVNEQRPCAKTTLINHLQKLQIGSLTKERPHRFAPDTPQRVLKSMNTRIVTLRELRAVKRKAQEARAA